eukprot:2781784-Pyramimonas_sp.AAC.1
MKQAQADIQNFKNGDAQSCTSGSTRYGSGDAGSGAGYNSNWVPSYIEFKGWISREGWNNREIKQRGAMQQQVLTDNITTLLGLASLDAAHNAACDHVRTAGGILEGIGHAHAGPSISKRGRQRKSYGRFGIVLKGSATWETRIHLRV